MDTRTGLLTPGERRSTDSGWRANGWWPLVLTLRWRWGGTLAPGFLEEMAVPIAALITIGQR